jgi:hypothetical protein
MVLLQVVSLFANLLHAVQPVTGYAARCQRLLKADLYAS